MEEECAAKGQALLERCLAGCEDVPPQTCEGRCREQARKVLAECVASDAEGYVEIAVRLAQDQGYRAAVEDKIRAASPRLFEDVDAAREHERLFEQMVDEARSRSETQ